MAETDVIRPLGVVDERRRYGVFHWGLLVSGLLLLLTVVVLALVLFVDVGNTALVLSVLVACLIAVGISACIFLEWLHRRALRRRDDGAKAWIHHTINENQLALAEELTPIPEPNAPSLTPRSSWIHWAPWKSPRSTGPPSSRSTAPSSSRSTDSPSYTAVARNGR